jgi:hypothetical protein
MPQHYRQAEDLLLDLDRSLGELAAPSLPVTFRVTMDAVVSLRAFDDIVKAAAIAERDRQRLATSYRREALCRELRSLLSVMKRGWRIVYDELLSSSLRSDPVLPGSAKIWVLP